MLRAAAAVVEGEPGTDSRSSGILSNSRSASNSSRNSCCTTDVTMDMSSSHADPKTGEADILSASEVFAGTNAAFNNGLQDLASIASSSVMESFSASGSFSVPQQQQPVGHSTHHQQQPAGHGNHQQAGTGAHHQPTNVPIPHHGTHHGYQVQVQVQPFFQPSPTPMPSVHVVNQTLKDMGITPAGGVSALSVSQAYRDMATASQAAATRDIPASSASGTAGSGSYHHVPGKQIPQRAPTSQQQPIICVPNQQAPYPHMQQPQARLGGGSTKVPMVKHMGTGSNQRQLHIQPQQIQHIHKIQSKPGGGMHVQTQQVGGSGVAPSHVRHFQHQSVSNPKLPLQVGRKPASSGSSVPAVPPGRYSQQKLPSAGTTGQLGYHGNKPGSGKPLPPWLPPLAQGVDNPRDSLCFTLEDRNMRILPENDSQSQYSLARRWVRSDVPRNDQVPPSWGESFLSLPKPLSVAEVQACRQNGDGSLIEDDAEELKVDSVEDLSEEELLQRYVSRFLKVRKRFRDIRMKKIARYRHRLDILMDYR